MTDSGGLAQHLLARTQELGRALQSALEMARLARLSEHARTPYTVLRNERGYSLRRYAAQPGKPRGAGIEDGGAGMEDGGPADSTESFSAVDQQSFPRSTAGDSTESFPAMRPRADLEDAFRLFPPVRGTDNRPTTDGQD